MMRCVAAGSLDKQHAIGLLAAARFPQDASSKRCSSPQGQETTMDHASGSIAQTISVRPAPKPAAPRTRLLLEGPIVTTLLRLAAPNVVVNVVLIAVTATVDAHFIG